MPDPFKQNYEQVVAKKLDAIMDITPKEDRKKHFHFTKAYIEILHIIVGREDEDYYSSEQDIKNKTIADQFRFLFNSLWKISKR